MFIITGTGRCGTGTLAKIFGGHHEFRAHYIVQKYFRDSDPFSDPFSELDARLSVVRDLHEGIDAGSFVDSSNLYIHFIDAVQLTEPSTKFLLLVRDGRDFVRSAYTRGWHSRTILGEVPPRHDPHFARWRDMTPIEKNAWIWTHRNRKALKGLSSVPSSHSMVLKIEDLNKQGVLSDLETFSGHKIEQPSWAHQRFNANSSAALPAKENWTQEMRDQFEKIAADMMRFFGYG